MNGPESFLKEKIVFSKVNVHHQEIVVLGIEVNPLPETNGGFAASVILDAGRGDTVHIRLTSDDLLILSKALAKIANERKFHRRDR